MTAGTAVGRIADALVVFAPVVVLLGLIAGIGVVVRFFRAEGIARQQLKWRAVGVIVSLSLFPLAVTENLPFFDTSLDAVVFVLTLAVPVLRYRLWSIDTILRRSLVYGAITVAHAAAAGQPVFGAALAGRLRIWFASPPRQEGPFPELSARERDILDHLAAGLSNTETGQRLHLSSKTVANNISAILAKLHLTQRSQAIVQARDAGLGRPR